MGELRSESSEDNGDWQLYPNPTRDLLHIRSDIHRGWSVIELMDAKELWWADGRLHLFREQPLWIWVLFPMDSICSAFEPNAAHFTDGS